METETIMIRSVNGQKYECVRGHAQLLRKLSRGLAVCVQDVETGERFKLVMHEGSVTVMHGIEKQIAETLAHQAIERWKRPPGSDGNR